MKMYKSIRFSHHCLRAVGESLPLSVTTLCGLETALLGAVTETPFHTRCPADRRDIFPTDSFNGSLLENFPNVRRDMANVSANTSWLADIQTIYDQLWSNCSPTSTWMSTCAHTTGFLLCLHQCQYLARSSIMFVTHRKLLPPSMYDLNFPGSIRGFPLSFSPKKGRKKSWSKVLKI